MKLTLWITFVIFFLIGCAGPSDDGLSKTEKDASSRIAKIAEQSGGDWNKVSETDRQYLIQEVAMGSEESAKRLLLAKAGGMRANPGDAPSKR